MKYDSRIIHKPHAQSRLRRGLFGAVTLAFWAIYAYLWLPLLTLLLWLLGVRTAVLELYLREHRIDMFLLVSLPMLALASAAVLIAWAEYNRFRFRDGDRRGTQPNVDNREIASAFGSSLHVANTLSTSKVTMLRMDETGTPALAIPRPGFGSPVSSRS